ncbi:c-type cytochrome, partial [Acidisphaera rubrifaciens]|uniref:c-type cytochrome n=1 Tax=Acidisphaera rubrifaciens TaxID=50715 RepID=UPI000A0310AB
MDSLYVNKAVAAVLTAGIAFFVTGLLGDELIRVEVPKKPAIVIASAEPAKAEGGAKKEGPDPIEPLLASADPEAGKAYTKTICVACHNFQEGGANGVGPDLYGVLGRKIASKPGFDYSSALKAKQGVWTYDELNEWLYKPAAFAPGTRMSFAGLPNDKTRANVIAYLRSLSHNPEPLPKPTDVPKQAAAAAPAGGEPAKPSFDAMLVSADPAAGKAYTKTICVACHTFDKGGKAGVGPNLWGVVGAPHGHMAGFDYSSALKSKQGPWTYDELNQWLTSPAKYAPGTRMSFAGIPSEKTRANVVAYLRTLSDNPEPLPKVEGATPAKAEAPVAAGGGAAAKGGDTPPPMTDKGGPASGTPEPASK